MKHSINDPLTEPEFDRLGAFLDTLGPAAMTIEMIDGFFVALLCGPELIQPVEWLPEIWGGEPNFRNNSEADEILALLMRHWNAVADTLDIALHEDDLFEPFLYLDDKGVALGNEWALGFMTGMDMRHDSWDPIFENDDYGVWLLPIFMLYHENDPDPTMRTEPKALESREDVIETMLTGVVHVYRFFEASREENALRDTPEPMRREHPKVGRNDPCPCGSGRKYKQCCGKN